MDIMIYFLLYYAVVYMGNAVYGTFIPVYFSSVGASPAEIGALLSFGPLVAILAQPVWGAIGDRARSKNAVLFALLAGSGISVLFFPVSNAFLYLLLIICVFTFFQTSIFAISDTITLEQLETQKKWSFGPIRMGGTIGFALMSMVFGFIARQHIRMIFVVYALIMLASILLLTRFPKVSGHQSGGSKVKIWVLLKHRRLMIYLALNFFLQVTLGYYYTFFPVYFRSLGGDNSLLGWAMVISSLSEVPFLLFSARIFRRFSISVILLVAGIATALRWLLFYLFTDPFQVVATQVLHGLMFIVLTVTLATYINKEVPKELKASGQTLNGLLNLGAARIIGSFFGGLAVEWIGMRSVFLYCAIIALVCVAVFSWLGLREERIKPAVNPSVHL